LLDLSKYHDPQPVSLEKDHPIIAFTELIHKQLHVKSFYKDSNTDVDVALAYHIPTVTIGTSVGYQTHSIHEYLEIDSVKKGYQQLLEMIIQMEKLPL
jgi:di/tripeptidase